MIDQKTVLRTLKEFKWLFIILVLLLGIGYAMPLLYMGDAPIRDMERNLMNLDLMRSTILYLFDSTLLAFVIFAPLLLLLNGVTYNKLRQLKGVALILLLFSTPIITVDSGTSNDQIYLKQQKPLAKYIFILTFDGTRADVFWSIDTFMKSKLNESVYADKIVTIYPTVTYPGHISLLTGTWPQIHGTENNPPRQEFGARPYSSYLRQYHKPKVDDLLDIASRYGYLTAVFVAPATMASIIGGPETYRVYGGGSERTMNSTINYLEENLAEVKSKGLVALIHLVDTDSAGHEYGSDSIEYRREIKKSAELVERLFNKLESLGLLDDSVIIFTADHGMYGNRHHNVYPPLVAEIPLWMWGKPFKKGYKLGGGRIVDIAPTVYFILGVPIPDYVVGVPLYTAFNATYIESVRGEKLDLEALEKEAIKKMLGRIYGDIIIWYTLVVLMVCLLIGMVFSLIRFRKEIRKKIGKKQT